MGGIILSSNLFFMCKCLITNQKCAWKVRKISLFSQNYKVANFQRNKRICKSWQSIDCIIMWCQQNRTIMFAGGSFTYIIQQRFCCWSGNINWAVRIYRKQSFVHILIPIFYIMTKNYDLSPGLTNGKGKLQCLVLNLMWMILKVMKGHLSCTEIF